MAPTRLQEINEYVTELFEALYEWDLDNLAMQIESPTLQKALLATLELHARKCLDCIKKRIGVEN